MLKITFLLVFFSAFCGCRATNNNEIIEKKIPPWSKSAYNLLEILRTINQYRMEASKTNEFRQIRKHNESSGELFETWPLDYILNKKYSIPQKLMKLLLTAVFMKKIAILISLTFLIFAIPIFFNVRNVSSYSYFRDEAEDEDRFLKIARSI
jgi:hypothetical protein